MPFDPFAHPVLPVAVAVGILVALTWVWARRTQPLPYFSQGTLLTRSELAFYKVLRTCLPNGLMLAYKVRLSDVIGCPGWAWKKGWGAKISQKHVDFVVIEVETSAIRVVIELDDRSHQRADRRERDAFVDQAMAAAGVPILHVPTSTAYDPASLRALLRQTVRSSAS